VAAIEEWKFQSESQHAEVRRLREALLVLTVAARGTDDDLLVDATEKAETVLGLDVVQAREAALAPTPPEGQER
jgi:hypothetical protein